MYRHIYVEVHKNFQCICAYANLRTICVRTYKLVFAEFACANIYVYTCVHVAGLPLSMRFGDISNLGLILF